VIIAPMTDSRQWSEAYESLVAADREKPLAPEDLEQLAIVAYLVGEDSVSADARARAHSSFLARGDLRGAARNAFWIGFTMMEKPSARAQAAGWFARARRLVDELQEPCVEEGWLLCASARDLASSRDFAAAFDAFSQAIEIAERFGDRDLIALARHGRGRALVMMNRGAEGLLLLDEVMISITAGEITPMVAGAVYCSVITACADCFDVQRAQEWTAALQRWCSEHPDLVPFRGYCLIRRSELMQLHGEWQDAYSEAVRACERLNDPPSQPEAGASYYQLGELHRVRGDFARAEDAYRLASQAGRKPMPGMALLRLSQEQIDAAGASIRSALTETRDRRMRILLLNAAVEILLAARDVEASRAASDELVQMAGDVDELPFLRAVCSQARGAVALAEERAADAAESLRTACAAWQELGAPYELARARVLIGLAYRQLGDAEGAQLEWDAASELFERLGAAPDSARLSQIAGVSPAPGSDRLTGREVEVLRLMATGATNRAIAVRLSISEKTVARHVSNIFMKLDLSSRAAATAYAYDHKLV
jgi:DNA-binding CsgD family transcriptional regulator